MKSATAFLESSEFRPSYPRFVGDSGKSDKELAAGWYPDSRIVYRIGAFSCLFRGTMAVPLSSQEEGDNADRIPGYSGGTVADSHRIPLVPRPLLYNPLAVACQSGSGTRDTGFETTG